jgi:hypothetical protein
MPYGWDDLVLNPPSRDEVEDILAWVRHEETLMHGWQLAKRLKPKKCHPLEGPLSTPDTSPCPSLPGVAWFRTLVLGQYRLVAVRCAPVFSCIRYGDSAPATHRDQGAGAGNRLQHPWHICAPRKSSVPGRVQGWRTAVVSYPEERGAIRSTVTSAPPFVDSSPDELNPLVRGGAFWRIIR